MTVALLAGALGVSKGNAAWVSQSGAETLSAGNLEREAASGTSGLTQLWIPQRMEIVIDPWEMDEKEQIYSEEYIIRNTGETPGILTLDFTCETGGETGLSFQGNSEGLHDFGEKLIYMKVIFGNGEEVVFTQEGAKYQVELQSGEALSLRFTGEVNENAEESWKDGDIKIEGTYSWEGEIAQSEEVLEEINETGRENAGETVPPFGSERDDDMELVPPTEPESDCAGEVPPDETEEETIRDNSLSGNELEEKEER